jgi:ribosomal protein L14E/L6E/L27E
VFEVGQIVYSKAGREKGRAFVVVKAEGNYLYLAEGALRRLENPKKKKIMHIQKTHEIPEGLNGKLLSGVAYDSDIAGELKRRSLKEEEPCQKPM